MKPKSSISSSQRPARITVYGTSCSGKTTFARRLAQMLQAPHVELDTIYWRPDWQPRPREEFMEIATEKLSGDNFVVDGNYTALREFLMERVDTVIWLNYPLILILWRCIQRIVGQAFRNEEHTNGCQDTFRRTFCTRDSIFLWVLKSHPRRKEQLQALFAQYGDSNISLVELKSPRAAELYLAQLQT